uniref:TIDP3108 n=1 Tax=Arundo donax TaxID=35708 RepID=A0A0A9ELY6_ARUDO
MHPGGRAHAAPPEQARPDLLRRVRALRPHAHRSGHCENHQCQQDA